LIHNVKTFCNVSVATLIKVERLVFFIFFIVILLLPLFTPFTNSNSNIFFASIVFVKKYAAVFFTEIAIWCLHTRPGVICTVLFFFLIRNSMFHAMDLFPYQRVPTASITLYPNHKNYIQESVIKSVMY